MLTACGIETIVIHDIIRTMDCTVATVLTACGIETNWEMRLYSFHKSWVLQRCLPLAVLKLAKLKPALLASLVATALTACGIET